MVELRMPVFAFAAALMLGCGGTPAGSQIPEGARAALEEADQFELLSLDPNPQPEKSGDDFRGWKVLGRTPVGDSDTRKELVAALTKGAGESDGMVAGCFNPRHGIRATREGEAVDLVICFECLQVQVYAGAGRAGSFLTTRSPQPVFDRVLREAGVPLAGAAGP
jgi:hypothetical protein